MSRARVWTVGVLLTSLLLVALPVLAESDPGDNAGETPEIDNRIWSISYWQQLAAQGLVEVAPNIPFEPAVYLGPNNELDEFEDGPDVVTSYDLAVHQSENSVFVDPSNPDFALNSNNSSDWPLGTFYGVSSFYSADVGETWDGTPDGWGQGDPAACIDTDGNWYLGHIGSNQSSSATGVTVSTDGGQTYTTYQVAPADGFLDKNHLWIDLTGGQYHNRLYAAWTPFGGSNVEDIAVAYSTDDAQTWSNQVNVSDPVGSGALCQGVNLDVGPNGEVYACWVQYDGGGLTETSIGFNRSFDGGETWDSAFRAIDDINGIRSYNGMLQNHRKNSFPVMTVDVSGGADNGSIYIVWTNLGEPGVNQGSDVATWMIKSTDQGDTWSDPIRVQSDDPGDGNQHYFPWIHCDPVTGTLSAVWYDNRNTTGGAVETWIGISYDGGDTWEDYRVSDVAFTPAPIPGFATGYFGDYLGIYGRDGVVYPVWTDNRNGVALTYTSAFYTERPPLSVSLSTQFNPPIIIPPGGGTILYGGSVSYNLDFPVTGNVWTEVILPNGNTYPLNNYTIPFTPGYSLTVQNQTLAVPSGAPAGVYNFFVKGGQFPNLVIDEDSFEFIKIGFDADSQGGPRMPYVVEQGELVHE